MRRDRATDSRQTGMHGAGDIGQIPFLSPPGRAHKLSSFGILQQAERDAMQRSAAEPTLTVVDVNTGEQTTIRREQFELLDRAGPKALVVSSQTQVGGTSARKGWTVKTRDPWLHTVRDTCAANAADHADGPARDFADLLAAAAVDKLTDQEAEQLLEEAEKCAGATTHAAGSVDDDAAGQLRYAHFKGWGSPVSYYYVEKITNDVWTIYRPLCHPDEEDAPAEHQVQVGASQEVGVFERVNVSAGKESDLERKPQPDVMGPDPILFHHLQQGLESPYTQQNLLAACPVGLRAGQTIIDRVDGSLTSRSASFSETSGSESSWADDGDCLATDDDEHSRLLAALGTASGEEYRKLLIVEDRKLRLALDERLADFLALYEEAEKQVVQVAERGKPVNTALPEEVKTDMGRRLGRYMEPLEHMRRSNSSETSNGDIINAILDALETEQQVQMQQTFKEIPPGQQIPKATMKQIAERMKRLMTMQLAIAAGAVDHHRGGRHFSTSAQHDLLVARVQAGPYESAQEEMDAARRQMKLDDEREADSEVEQRGENRQAIPAKRSKDSDEEDAAKRAKQSDEDFFRQLSDSGLDVPTGERL